MLHFLRNSEIEGIPRFFENFEESRETLLIFELLGGDINSKEVALRDLPRLLEETTRTLASLHLRGFVHFDIRPDNILFVRDSSDSTKTASARLEKSSSVKKASQPSLKWFKKLKLLEEFENSKRPSHMFFGGESNNSKFLKKQTLKNTLSSFSQLNSNSENRKINKQILQKIKLKKSSEKRKNKFKLGDFGLSFNQFNGRLLGFGDNMFLAPELLKSTGRGQKVTIWRSELTFRMTLPSATFILWDFQ